VREVESGDSEDGEDDELPWVMRWKWWRLCLTMLAKISGELHSIDMVQHTEKSDC